MRHSSPQSGARWQVLVGHPAYTVTGGTAAFKGKDLWELEPEERSHEGLFLSFQSPIEIPGVSNTDFLRSAYNARMKSMGKPELDPLEFYAHLMPKVRATSPTVPRWNARRRAEPAGLVLGTMLRAAACRIHGTCIISELAFQPTPAPPPAPTPLESPTSRKP
jgi:hypothetical protein